MFGLIARIKQARAERLRRKKLMEEQDARIARGFRELHTAVELVGQVAGGRGPRGNVVRIGDGFFVERTEDGKERAVLIEKLRELPPLPPRAVLDVHVAKLNEYRAKLGEFTAKFDEFREKAEKAGFTNNHPSVLALAEILPLEPPKLDLPELPKFDITAPPTP